MNENYWETKYPEGLEDEEILEANPTGKWSEEQIQILLQNKHDLIACSKLVKKSPEQCAMMISKLPIHENFVGGQIVENASSTDHSLEFFSSLLKSYSQAAQKQSISIPNPKSDMIKRKKKEMRKLLDKILELEKESVEAYLDTLEFEDH